MLNRILMNLKDNLHYSWTFCNIIYSLYRYKIFPNNSFSSVPVQSTHFRVARLKNAFLTGLEILRVTSLINIISVFACQFSKLGQVFVGSRNEKCLISPLTEVQTVLCRPRRQCRGATDHSLLSRVQTDKERLKLEPCCDNLGVSLLQLVLCSPPELLSK